VCHVCHGGAVKTGRADFFGAGGAPGGIFNWQMPMANTLLNYPEKRSSTTDGHG